MNSKYNISFYSNIFKTKEGAIITFESFLNDVRAERFKPEIDRLRKYLTDGNEAMYKAEKKKLAAITPSGTFSERKEAGLIAHSQILSIDFDGLENPVQAKAEIIKEPFVMAAFISPSDKGLKVFVKIAPEQHKAAFVGLQHHFKSRYEIDNDKGCHDVSRLCFVSSDKDVFINLKSEVYNFWPVTQKNELLEKQTQRPGPKNNKPQSPGFDKQNEVEKLITEIEATKKDITGDYSQWLNVGFALASEFGTTGEDYFNRISVFSTSYDAAICKEQYKKCCNSKKAGIGINTLFAIAKSCNVLVYDESKKPIGKPKGIAGEINKNEIVFYNPQFKTDDEGNQVLKDIKINYVKFTELIYSFGFRRFDIDKEFIYVQLQSNVIKEVTRLQIQDFFFSYLEGLPDALSNGITKKALKEKMYNNPQNFFCDNRLSLLINKEPFIFNEDTKSECFIYYKNGYVKSTKDGYELKPYNQLQGFIWYTQIIQRDFSFLSVESYSIKEMSVYAQFLYNVSGKNKDNFDSLCSLIGYLLHGYTDVKMKAIILTDSRISDEANGRTGKTLFGNTLRHIKRLTQINGKDFDPTNKNKYQEANLDTQIIFLNDVRSNFRFEVLYNDITEGITVEKKNKNPFSVKAKMCITTNKTIAIEGSSSKDRSIEFEFADHYNDRYSPEDEFKQRFFSQDWKQKDWQQFDNFMMFCICVFLRCGIIEPQNINLNQRKLLDQTHASFLEFMNEKISNNYLVPGYEMNKQDFHNLFLNEYSELRNDKYRGRLETFTTWMKKFVKYDPRFLDEFKDRKSGDKRYFTIESVKK
jgi:VirE N-terminal domain/Primase C terminal 2 (PriCT-2)